MALKQLVIGKKIESLRMQLVKLDEKGAEFSRRDAEMKTREEALEIAVGEIAEGTPDGDRLTVESAVTEYEADRDLLEGEKSEHEKEKSRISGEIKALQDELEELNKKAVSPPVGTDSQKRKDENHMKIRGGFYGMNCEQRDVFFRREDVKEFLTRARDLGRQKRAVSGAELLIPTVVLDLVRENIEKYSKLISKVNAKPVAGKARQNIMGTVPEGVWTEACGALNELALSFSSVEVDGYKVGGYIVICNATLDDSDIALANELISALGQAIGYAVDKAILYGTGVKMPLGIVTRIAQTTKPANYPTHAREWVDLHSKNMITIGTSANKKQGAALFKEIVLASGAAKGKYSRGGKFWAMSDTTYTTLMAEALSINAAGAIVSGQMGTMPVISGDIILLDFVPDGDIVGGYGDLYLLAERAGTALEPSEHVRFFEDQTAFKGTARYDGTPSIAEGFVAMNILGAAPTTSVSFASDTANAPKES